MSDFVKDTWSDLREKRLWPVALVLAIAIVAVPVVLAKSPQSPAPSAGTVVTDRASSTPTLALDTQSAAASGTGSSLDVFTPDDPFTPPQVVALAATAGAVDLGASAAGADETVDVSIGKGGGGETIDETIDVVPPKPQRESTTETASYEYVADISFWQGQRRRAIKGLRKLDMLPNQAAPLLIFMGASDDGGNATFLLDSTLTTAGEGTCRPSRSNCAFVDIGPGAEHVFTTEEGESFRLRVEEIRRVKVKAGASASGMRPAAHTSIGEQPAARRFVLPSLIDLVEVTTTTTTTTIPSSDAEAGR